MTNRAKAVVEFFKNRMNLNVYFKLQVCMPEFSYIVDTSHFRVSPQKAATTRTFPQSLGFLVTGSAIHIGTLF